MATLNIPDNTPIAELDRLARAMGKRLQYRANQPRKPQPEEPPHGHNRRAAHLHVVPALADEQRHNGKDAQQ